MSSGLPLKADIAQLSRHAPKVPPTEVVAIDHHVGAAFGGAAPATSSLIIVVGMHPRVRRDLALAGQLDHVNGRRVSQRLHDRHFNTHT
jgi:hypothetical protein